MSRRRILALWFPRLAAERLLRAEPQLAETPLAVVADIRGALSLASLTAAAEAAGLRRGMMLGDARAICPGLVTRPEDVRAAAGFLAALRRWAGRFSPWVAEEAEALVLDITGCAHLFGGEPGLVAAVETGVADLGLTLRLGLADTVGAAWAVARHAGAGAHAGVPGRVHAGAHAGDAIDQEARATRSRAQKRRWERGGAPPLVAVRSGDGAGRIVPPGETIAHIGGLPAAALRLAPDEVRALDALGLASILQVAAVPRAQLARRVGIGVGRRLDQALGRVPEPVSPAPPPPVFALRLTLPEPVGREADVLAGLDRLLPPLCARLQAAGRGARRVRLTLVRSDGRAIVREVGLARPADRPEAIRPLLALALGEIDAGFGIEVLRLEAAAVEPLGLRQHRGQLAVTAAARREGTGEGLADLIGRIGARLGLEALVRLHPADSHIPEKAATELAAAFSAPAAGWPPPAAPRPALLFPPEPLTPQAAGTPPAAFVWRRRSRRRAAAYGPERIAPEWWLDDPAWRSGPRDYWRVETDEGTRLWIYEARGAALGAGWFAQGVFA
jgi:protein ImuB